MSSTVADAAGERAPSAAPPAAKALSSTLLSLVRREFWEHRALWLGPAVVAGLIVLGALTASVKYRAPNLDMSGDEGPWHGMAMFGVMQGSVTMPLALVTTIVLVFYLLDCLYAERKDRSILFWKSLPVSDGLTVLSKLLVALLLVPLGVFALGLVLSLALTGIWQVNAFLGRLPAIPGWDMAGWLQTELALLLCFAVGALWYAPCAAYLLLVSAWARRNPFLWLILPPVAAQILERVAFGTHYVASFIGYRLFGIWPKLFGHMHFGRGRAHMLGAALAQLDLGAALADLDLWLGLAAAAGLTFAAIRIRRYRDDT
jgi:ABC-2 type transport system permease protein